MVALVAFAANSFFCRLALLDRMIEPSLFAAVRLASGALLLGLLCLARGDRLLPSPRLAVIPAAMLFFYAIPFTFAYVELPTGTGALILFGAVQLTMMLSALRAGHRPSIVEWSGLATAIAGLVYLAWPGIEAPNLTGSILMAVAGISWGFYTLRGKRSRSALADTGGNFILAALPAIVIGGAGLPGSDVRPEGLWLAVASGALASGLGYALWYSALRSLTSVRAAVVQLAVPVIAALAGVIFLSESATPRLLIAGTAILGGIGITIIGHRRH